MVLQSQQPKMLKKHWFYCKTSPSNGQQPSKWRIRGLKFTYSFWRYYEEPLQPSCLGKKAMVLQTKSPKDIEKPLVLL